MQNVLVMLSTYNGERHLKQQLDSIVSQAESDLSVKILARDDGSLDGTLRIMEAYTAQLTCLPARNIGAARSFLELIHRASADEHDYFAFSDQDDVWKPGKLKRATGILKSVSGPALYISNATICDFRLENQQDTEICFSKQSIYNALIENIGIGMTMVMNRELLLQLQKTSPKYVFMHDWWVYIVASMFGTVKFDKESYVFYRQHEDNVIGYGSSFLERLRRRLNRAVNAKERFYPVIRQTESFLDCYGSFLDKDTYHHLAAWISCQRSWLSRLAMLSKLQIFRQRPTDHVLFIGLFSLGFYNEKR